MFIIAAYCSLLYGGSETISLQTGGDNFILNEIRIPKTITAMFAGCALSVSGLILQIIFRNPLAGPYVLGISSGAALMVAAGVLTGNALVNISDVFTGKGFIVLSAVTGSLAVTFLILFVSRKVHNNVVLLLIGLMFSQICGAIQTSLEYFADPASLKNFVIWGMGSVAGTTLSDLWLYLPVTAVCLFAIVFYIKPLNAFLLGENYARNAGINYQSARFMLVLLSSLLTGVTTAYCGPIAFIGIAVPIISRMLFYSSRQEIHFFSCLLIGSIIMLFSDALANSVLKNVVLPLNMITTLIGAPVVIYLMFKNKQW